MKKMILAIVALGVMLIAGEEVQARERGGKQVQSAEQIARERSERQASYMHLNPTQYKQLYKLNLREARYMLRYQKKMRGYRADFSRIVGVENMKIYEANRMRRRSELQRPPRKGDGPQCPPCVKPQGCSRQQCPQPPHCQAKPNDKKCASCPGSAPKNGPRRGNAPGHRR